MRIIRKQFSGLCPEIGRTQTIQVELEEANMCGNPGEYKATTFYCHHRSEHGCNSCDPYGRCPFVKAAEQEVNGR